MQRDEHLRARCSDARMCEGAFGPSASIVLPRPAVRRRSSRAPLEVSTAAPGSIVLVDRHAGRRVRDVDERGGAPSASVRAPARTCSVMSSELRPPLGPKAGSPARAGILRDPCRRPREQPRRLPRRGGSLHRGARRGVLPPLRGPQGELELEPIYERFADLTTLEHGSRSARPERRPRASRELWQLRLRGLPRQPDARGGGGDRGARGHARGDGRRREDPLPDAPPDDRERGRPRAARAARPRDVRADRGAPEPGLPRRREASRGNARARRRRPTASSTSASASRSRSSPTQCARVPRRDRGSCTRTRFDRASARAASACRSTRPARWDVLRLFRAPRVGRGLPRRPDGAGARGTLDGLGIDLARRQNVHLDLEQRPQKSPRAFCAPIEVPDSVMLVIKPIGGAGRLARASSTRPGTRSTSRTSPATCRWSSGGSATTRSPRAGRCCSSTWSTSPAGSRAGSTSRARRSSRPRGCVGLLYFVRRYAAKLLYELEFHCGRRRRRRCRSATSELLADATKIELAEADYLADVDAGFYVTCYLRSWAFQSQLATTSARSFGRAWFTRARPARSSGSSGARASG